MASQYPNNTNNDAQISSQAQMRRDQILDQPSDQGQGIDFLKETGAQVKTMAYGAADVGKGAVNLAHGAVLGTANLAQGAASAMKNTFGKNTTNDDTSLPIKTGTTSYGPIDTNYSNNPNTKI